MEMGFTYDWCEERLEIQSIADDILAKFVPAHVNIFYCFGGIMLTSFIFQGGSGICFDDLLSTNSRRSFSISSSNLI